MDCEPSTSSNNDAMSDEQAQALADLINITEELTNYKLYKDRLRSFIATWSGYFISPQRMAKAGFYFIGPRTRVRCAFCCRAFEGWYDDHNDPEILHKQLVPNCEYFTKYDGVIPIIQVQPKYLKYLTIESRLKSFDKYKYKNKMVVDLTTVCEAGFFFEGASDKDRIQCFCCRLRIEDLHNDFDIWRLHARGEGRCSFLLLNKGKDFVMNVHGGFFDIPEIDYKHFLKLITYQQSGKIFYPLITYERKIIERIRDLKPRIRKGCGSSESQSIPDSLLCKICMKEKLQVLSLPCGHIFACVQCSITGPECSVCRRNFSMLIRIHLDFNRKVERNNALKWACTSKAVRFEEDFNPVLCQVCQKLEIQIALVPCNHVYCCFECAIESKECLICYKNVISFIYVYL